MEVFNNYDFEFNWSNLTKKRANECYFFKFLIGDSQHLRFEKEKKKKEYQRYNLQELNEMPSYKYFL